MGANNSTRRVSFESDENDNVTVVKGIRLSENVINRMRESSSPQQTPSPPRPTPSTPAPAPPLPPVPPPFSPITSAPAPVQLSPPAEPVAAPPKVAVDDSELRRKIAEELQRGLEEERSKNRQELHQWLEKERAQLQAQARADAQIQDKVSRILATERAAAEDSTYHAALRERVATENEKLRAQSKRLEERDRTLRKQEAFYREQVAKLEERSAQFYKVTNEKYHQAVDEVKSKFKRYEASPACTDLQDQILKCYRENVGKTLLCSSITSLYLQCVNNAKQKKLSTGG